MKGFQKGNDFGGRPKGSKNKKTLAFEALSTLTDIGINPISVSKELIDELVKNTELSDKDKIELLKTMTSLWKYQVLNQSEAHRIDELKEQVIELQNENETIKSFIGTPNELLNELRKKEK